MKDKELKAKWITALTDGSHLKGKNRLRGKAKMCCLGVLCDIIDPTKWVGNEYHYFNEKLAETDYVQDYLPKTLRIELGISAEQQEILAVMNDEEDTFIPIAKWIEENL